MHNFSILNGDTDSITVYKSDGKEFTSTERQNLLQELNSISPVGLTWEDDGYFSHVLVVKAKNYYLETPTGEIKIRGSALKCSMKEPALKEFVQKFIQTIVHGTIEDSVNLYHQYCREIMGLMDISRWCSRKTVTASVLSPERTNEQKVLDAIGDEDVQEGDKLSVFFAVDGSLKLQENWVADHDPYKLLEKLWKTVSIFGTVIDVKLFTKYHLKKQRELLDKIR